MNLLMYFNNVDVSLFKKKKKISNFDLLSQILPPISSKFANGVMILMIIKKH